MRATGPRSSWSGQRSARVPVGELGLRKGKKIAYLFDFGGEWRLTLKLVDSWPADDLAYPLLVGTNDAPVPPQYPLLQDD